MVDSDFGYSLEGNNFGFVTFEAISSVDHALSIAPIRFQGHKLSVSRSSNASGKAAAAAAPAPAAPTAPTNTSIVVKNLAHVGHMIPFDDLEGFLGALDGFLAG